MRRDHRDGFAAGLESQAQPGRQREIARPRHRLHDKASLRDLLGSDPHCRGRRGRASPGRLIRPTAASGVGQGAATIVFQAIAPVSASIPQSATPEVSWS